MSAVGPSYVVLNGFAGQILIMQVVRVPSKEKRGRFLRIERWPSRSVEGIGEAELGVPVGEVRAGPVVDGGPVHAYEQFIEPSGRDGSGVINPNVSDVIVVSTGSDAGGATKYASSYTLEYGPTWEGGVEGNAAMDGDGKIIVAAPNTGFGFVSVYYPNAPSDGYGGTGEGGANVYLNPCSGYSWNCSLTSEGSSAIVNGASAVTVDDTGAIWASFPAGSNLIQILGPGAPTWGQVSWQPEALKTNPNTTLRPF